MDDDDLRKHDLLVDARSEERADLWFPRLSASDDLILRLSTEEFVKAQMIQILVKISLIFRHDTVVAALRYRARKLFSADLLEYLWRPR